MFDIDNIRSECNDILDQGLSYETLSKEYMGLVFRNEGLNSQVEYLKDELKECNYIKENLEGDNDELETERANLIIENDKLKKYVY